MTQRPTLSWMVSALLAGLVAGCGSQASSPPTAAAIGPDASSERALAELGFLTRVERDAFLDAAAQAEALDDPLQRCLHYPDPPRTHWSRRAVEAYCHYRTQPVIDATEVGTLVGGGHADELDRRLAAVERAQQAGGDALGLLDHTFRSNFQDASPGLRATIAAWKGQSPQSAFAYAASGMAYLAAAQAARGGRFIDATPASQIEAMEALLAKARTDLRRAVTIDPALTPAHAALIAAERLSGDGDSETVTQQALAAGPADWAILSELMDAAEPKWGGSLDAMRALAAYAKKHADANPLLLLLLAEPAAYASGICGCGDAGAANPGHESDYYIVFDEVAKAQTLSEAATHAQAVSLQPDLAIVFISETLRFDPSGEMHRAARLEALQYVVRSNPTPAAKRFLEMETQRMTTRPSQDEQLLVAQAGALENGGDIAHAEALFKAAVERAPRDAVALAQLGRFYADHERWDDAWPIAERLIGAIRTTRTAGSCVPPSSPTSRGRDLQRPRRTSSRISARIPWRRVPSPSPRRTSPRPRPYPADRGSRLHAHVMGFIERQRTSDMRHERTRGFTTTTMTTSVAWPDDRHAAACTREGHAGGCR